MQFLEKKFEPSEWFVLVPTGIESLTILIETRIQLMSPFCVYQWWNIYDDEHPIVWHVWLSKWKMKAPILSQIDEECAHMLDPLNHPYKIVRVPNGIPLSLEMRDSYWFHTAFQKFYTRQSVEQIFAGLKKEWWWEYLYTRTDTWPMDFTPISELQRNLKWL